MRELAGKVALITGAASGIGRGLVDVAATHGMVVVATDVDTQGLAEVAASFAQNAVRGLTATLDVRDRAAWSELLDRVERDLGPVQLLCNNAGVVTSPMPMHEMPADAWDFVIGINLYGVFNGCHAVTPRLIARRLPGHIVNTSSVQGLFASPKFVPYNAAKFGIVGLSETLRMELETHDIGVSVLCPGPTRGNLMVNSAKLAPGLVRNTGRPRVGFTIYQTPAEVATKAFDAIRENRFYVIPHSEYAPVLEARAAAIDASLVPVAQAGIDNVLELEAEPLRFYRELAAQSKGS